MPRVLVFAYVFLLCCAVQAEPITYTFDVTGGTIGLGFRPSSSVTPNPVLSDAAGTFSLSIDQGGDGVEEGDGVALGLSYVHSTKILEWELPGLITATLPAGNLRLLDFDQSDAATIASDGSATANGLALAEIEGFTTSLPVGTPFTTVVWSDPGQMNLLFSIPASVSETLTVALQGTFPFITMSGGYDDIHMTITWDLILDIVGTAHVVPDPSLTGILTLGLVGAGGWLRSRRRS